jgi:hypothetical protein
MRGSHVEWCFDDSNTDCNSRHVAAVALDEGLPIPFLFLFFLFTSGGGARRMAFLGDRCWVASGNETLVWERGTVERRSDAGGVVAIGVRLEGSDALWECDFASPGALDAAIKPCNGEKPLAVPDLIALTHLHEAAVLDVVRSRAAAGVVYTAVGQILLAVNPYKPLPRLYGDGALQAYRAAESASALAPHCYGVAAGAGQESEIPNFKGSSLGRFPLVLADLWTSDHLSERSRSVDAFSGTRARGTLTLKRR